MVIKERVGLCRLQYVSLDRRGRGAHLRRDQSYRRAGHFVKGCFGHVQPAGDPEATLGHTRGFVPPVSLQQPGCFLAL